MLQEKTANWGRAENAWEKDNHPKHFLREKELQAELKVLLDFAKDLERSMNNIKLFRK